MKEHLIKCYKKNFLEGNSKIKNLRKIFMKIFIKENF